MTVDLTARIAKATAAALADVVGDLMKYGEHFHGNQYTGGIEGEHNAEPTNHAGAQAHEAQPEHQLDPSKMTTKQKEDVAHQMRQGKATFKQIATKLGYSQAGARNAAIRGRIRAEAEAKAKAEAEAKAQAEADAKAAQEAKTAAEAKAAEEAAAAHAAQAAAAAAAQAAAATAGPDGVYDHKNMSVKEKQDVAHQLREGGASLAEVAHRLGYSLAGARNAAMRGAERAGAGQPKPTGGGDKPKGRAYDLEETSKKIRAQQALIGKMKPDLVNDRYDGGPRLKAATAQNIASRMQGSAIEIAKAAGRERIMAGRTYIKSDGSVGVKDSSNIGLADAFADNPTVRYVTVPTGGASEVMSVKFPTEEAAKVADANGAIGPYRIATRAEAEQMLKESAVSTLIHSWAVSSNDTCKETLAIQRIAKQVFGLQRTAEWHQEKGAMKAEVDETIAFHGPALESFVRAQYAATQEALAQAGFKPEDTVTMYRGVENIPQVRKAKPGTKLDFEQRPLSSFAWSPQTASGFADSLGGVMEAQIPVSSIMGMPGVGFGCNNEYEVVCMASEQATLTKVETFGNTVTAGSAFAKKAAGDQDNPDDYNEFISIDWSIENADWTKGTWDSPFVQDLPTLMVFEHVGLEDMQACRDRINVLMTLPVWAATPATIKRQAAEFLKTGVMPPLPTPDNPATKSVLDDLYVQARKAILDEIIIAEELVKAFEMAKYGPNFHGNQYTGGISGEHDTATLQAPKPVPTFEPIDHTTLTIRQKEDEAHRMRLAGATHAVVAARLGYSQAGARNAAIRGAKRAAGGATPTPTGPKPAGGATTPTGEAKPTGGATAPDQKGPRLPEATIKELQAAKVAAQAKFDKAVLARTDAMLAGDYKQRDQAGREMMQTSRELGAKVTAAVDQHFASIRDQIGKTEGGAKVVTQGEVMAAKEALAQRANSLNMESRFNEAATRLEEARANVVDGALTTAFAAAAVPEGHEATKVPAAQVMAALSGRTGTWQLGNGVSIERGDGPPLVVYKPAGGGITKVPVEFTSGEREQLRQLGTLVRGNGAIAKTTGVEGVMLALGGNVVTETGGYTSNASPMNTEVIAGIAGAIGVDAFVSLRNDNQSLQADQAKIIGMQSGTPGSGSGKVDNALSTAYTDLMFNTIGSIRPLANAGDLNVKGVTFGEGGAATAKAREEIAQATTRLPADWIAATNNRYGGLQFRFKASRGEGSFSPAFGKIMIGKHPNSQGAVESGRTLMQSTLLHEITHSCQATNANIKALEQAFMADRGTGKYEQLKNYTKGTKGDPDQFSKTYTGRNYSGSPSGFQEVITTGMEGMITPPLAGVKLADDATFGTSGDNPDKDFQRFMAGTLLLA